MENPDYNLRERVSLLEAKLGDLSKSVADVSEKVSDIRDVLLKAQGAKWLALGAIGIGSFLASKLTVFSSLFGGH